MPHSLLHCIALSLIPGVGDVAAKKLVSYCGSPEGVFKTKKSHLLKIPGIGELTVNSILNHGVFDRAEKEIRFITKHKIEPLFYLDDAFPKRLRHCTDSPVMLYFKGNCDLNRDKPIGIVGTRNASEYGKKVTANLVAELAAYNASIISGMAYGIDICAHKAAVENQLPTIAVLAHGLDRLYPSNHKSTAERMLESGGLITEFMSETNPDRENFPKRNRIVAGMVDAVIVVEAGISGGALITAEIANTYNRDVFAVPGKLDDEYSAGCNRLIKTNKAALIESAKDIAYLLNWNNEPKKILQQQRLFVELNKEEEVLVQVIKEKGNIAIDDLSFLSSFPMSKVAGILLNLEFNGVVKSLPGKVYQLN
jgi:DNA processing protein